MQQVKHQDDNLDQKLMNRKLREISVHAPFGVSFQKDFNSQTWCMSEMYWYQIRDQNTNGISKVNILLTEKSVEPIIERHGEFLEITRFFDFSQYYKLGSFKRKKYLIELIHTSMVLGKSEILIPENVLERTFYSCQERKLENKWMLRNRLFKSPRSKKYGGVECNWDLDIFKADLIIFDSKKIEKKRKNILELEPFKGDFIYYTQPKWDDESTFSLYAKGDEKWSLTLNSESS